MDPVASDLKAGMVAARAGDKAQARTYLLRVLQADPRNETAWMWLSRVMATTEQALRCIEQLLTINPNHARAQEAREVLRIRLLLEEAAIFKQQPSAPSSSRRRYLLGEALVEAGVLTPAHLEQALQYQRAARGQQQPLRLGDVLLRLQLVQPEQLEAAVAAQIESALPATAPGGVGRLGEYLVRQGYLTLAQLHQALALQAQQRRAGQRRRLGEVLVQHGYLQPDQLARAILEWHQAFDMAFQ